MFDANDYTSTLVETLLVQAGVRPSAMEDIGRRLLRDKPTNIPAFLQTCRGEFPSYFLSAPEAAPGEPAPGEPGYNAWFLSQAERLAGGGQLAAATPAPGTLSTGKGQALPKVLRQDDPAYNKQFVAHLEEIASGAMTAEIKH